MKKAFIIGIVLIALCVALFLVSSYKMVIYSDSSFGEQVKTEQIWAISDSAACAKAIDKFQLSLYSCKLTDLPCRITKIELRGALGQNVFTNNRIETISCANTLKEEKRLLLGELPDNLNDRFGIIILEATGGY